MAPGYGQTGVSMIALGGPKLKLVVQDLLCHLAVVSMIALGGPKLKLSNGAGSRIAEQFQ